jgi:hypothetical protein
LEDLPYSPDLDPFKLERVHFEETKDFRTERTLSQNVIEALNVIMKEE